MRQVCLFLVLGALPLAAAAEGVPIAGIHPSERPAGAPVLTEMVKGSGWQARALTGVEAPIPPSLGFLKNQGAWFTPFDHPGMTGPYDIRHWHGGN
ncbi:hypothetical protein LHP98_13365 [Rhodobacter sp. Har01]|uniref:hypothetical protein n=1 Tax=Rhodobacter sp. Har01 TaxID=2883999 RepID=UPI001D095474|nr:hypothetical protein [Rhodobacter sp. Har01]MCB6179108.1 hypothetical protein [Rhodobacter sp. Har01]